MSIAPAQRRAFISFARSLLCCPTVSATPCVKKMIRKDRFVQATLSVQPAKAHTLFCEIGIASIANPVCILIGKGLITPATLMTVQQFDNFCFACHFCWRDSASRTRFLLKCIQALFEARFVQTVTHGNLPTWMLLVQFFHEVVAGGFQQEGAAAGLNSVLERTCACVLKCTVCQVCVK